jgi:hypothetical protein
VVQGVTGHTTAKVTSLHTLIYDELTVKPSSSITTMASSHRSIASQRRRSSSKWAGSSSKSATTRLQNAFERRERRAGGVISRLLESQSGCKKGPRTFFDQNRCAKGANRAETLCNTPPFENSEAPFPRSVVSHGKQSVTRALPVWLFPSSFLSEKARSTLSF